MNEKTKKKLTELKEEFGKSPFIDFNGKILVNQEFLIFIVEKYENQSLNIIKLIEE